MLWSVCFMNMQFNFHAFGSPLGLVEHKKGTLLDNKKMKRIWTLRPCAILLFLLLHANYCVRCCTTQQIMKQFELSIRVVSYFVPATSTEFVNSTIAMFAILCELKMNIYPEHPHERSSKGKNIVSTDYVLMFSIYSLLILYIFSFFLLWYHLTIQRYPANVCY